MGYNAGAYGSMTFPTTAALAAWKATTVSHTAFTDWIEDLRGTYAADETVVKRLARVARGHSAKSSTLQEITIEGTTVSLLYDTGEDEFREGSGDIAALVRCADRHGAKDSFTFLGTAGAEGDFAYSLVLNGRSSKVTRLAGAALEKAYGADYEAFRERVMGRYLAAHPEFAEQKKRDLDDQAKATAFHAADGDPASRLDRAIAVLSEKAPTMAMATAAEAALVEIDHPDKERKLEALLIKLGKTARPPAAAIPAIFVIRAIETLQLRALAPALKTFVKSKKSNANAKVMAEWVLDRWSKQSRH